MSPLPAYDPANLHLYECGRHLASVAEFVPGHPAGKGSSYVLHKLVLARICPLAMPAGRLELFEEIPGGGRRLICAMKVDNHTFVASNLIGPAPTTTILAHQIP